MASDTNLGELQASIHNFLGSLLTGIEAESKPDASLPNVIVRNRRQRARQRLEDALLSRGSNQITPNLKDELESLLREWARHSFEDGFKPMQDFEIQCARERDLVQAEESGDPNQILAVLEKRYRAQVIEQYGSVELRGIQISHRVILDLDEVYVPLRVREAVATRAEKGGKVVVLAEEFGPAREIWQRKRHVLLVGAPGSGKSTLVSYFATGIADGRLVDEFGWRKGILPFVLIVRTLSSARFTPEWFAQCLGIDRRLASAAIQQDRVVLLVDGVDEAAPEIREQLLSGLNDFLKENPAIRALVTSRPAGGVGETEKCFPSFKHFQLADFTLQDVDIFIEKWCLAAEKSVRKDATEARKQAQDAANDLKTRISYNRPVQRIAVNPLLTTILCVVHRFLGRSIPEHRVTLYEKCTDALLYEWDRAKFPAGAAVGALDALQKRALLRGVARSLHEKHAAEISEHEVIQHFAKMLPHLGKPQSDAQRIVHEIRDRSGLLVERRPGYFGFSHLTFQEYLTALDYVSSRSWTQLITRAGNPWWSEVIPLAAGVQGAESAVMIEMLLKTKTQELITLAAQCAETAVDLPLNVRQAVEGALDELIDSPELVTSELGTIGMTLAPVLMKRLSNHNAEQGDLALWILEYIDYEPAIPLIAQYVHDRRPSSYKFGRLKQDGVPIISYSLRSLGEHATYTLLLKARSSDTALRAFLTALEGKSRSFLCWIRKSVNPSAFGARRATELLGAIDAALKQPAERQEKHSSKRSKSTA